MSEYDHEPVRGLPETLPEDEHIIWQGGPDWRRLFASALHVRLAAIYFAVIAATAALSGDFASALAMVVFAGLVLALFALFAWGVERTTVYTLTNQRVVMRIGVALNKCINIPLREIAGADLKPLSGGAGSIVLQLKGTPRLGYLMLWPHARSLRIVRPQPMLRAIPNAGIVAQHLLEATRKLQPVAPASESAATSTPLEGMPA